ncbi:MAG: FtsX-like permease family protein [Bryobacteraceae bacterium]|nr:FtsX-like permease family protein [Bryobacteraceae bacterium]
MNWKTAAKIAWREGRASSIKFFFVILAVAAGVGALTGVRGFAAAFRQLLLKEARTLMAADISVRQFVLPNEEQQAKLAEFEKQGITRTWITETVTMAATARVPDPLLVSVKAVDPSGYPFYGQVLLKPPGPLAAVLTPDQVAVSEDLLLRLQMQIGDTIKVGGIDFRVAAIVDKEPDRMAGSLNVGPRLMMSRQGLDRTNLLRFGSRAAQRLLFKLPPPVQGPAVNAATVERVRTELKSAFPEAMVIDFRETHPLITRGLTRSTTFLSLVSLIALIVGAIGVAMAIHSHVQQRLDSIAIMKCLGANSTHVMRIYLLQTLALGLLGGLVGVCFGAAIQSAFPLLIARYFQIAPDFRIDPSSVAQGILIGLLATVLFTAVPLLAVRHIRPILILRRDMGETRLPWRERLRRQWPALLAGLLILLGMAGIAGWLSEGSWRDAARLGLFFVGGLAFSLALLSGAAWLLLWLLRRFQQHVPYWFPSAVRHGIANLYRPGNQASAVLVALGVGVMFTLTVYLVQQQMIGQLAASAPPGMPNVFLIDIQESQKDALVRLLKSQPGVQKEPEIVPAVSIRLKSVNGAPLDSLNLKGFDRRFLQTRTVTWYDSRPDFVEMASGAWLGGPNDVLLNEDAAKALKAKPGTALQFDAYGRPINVRVVGTFKIEQVRLGSGVEFIFPRAQLAGLPLNYFGGVRVKTSQVAALQRASYRQFPTVSVINVADVLDIIQEVVDQIAVVVRFISGFAILAGIIILASSVAGTRFRRVREVAILKTLGGTRRRIAAIFSIEFLVLGALAGLLGGLLASGFTQVLMSRFFEADPIASALPVFVAIAGSALIANLAGWLASSRILAQRPLRILRDE